MARLISRSATATAGCAETAGWSGERRCRKRWGDLWRWRIGWCGRPPRNRKVDRDGEQRHRYHSDDSETTQRPRPGSRLSNRALVNGPRGPAESALDGLAVQPPGRNVTSGRHRDARFVGRGSCGCARPPRPAAAAAGRRGVDEQNLAGRVGRRRSGLRRRDADLDSRRREDRRRCCGSRRLRGPHDKGRRRSGGVVDGRSGDSPPARR